MPIRLRASFYFIRDLEQKSSQNFIQIWRTPSLDYEKYLSPYKYTAPGIFLVRLGFHPDLEVLVKS